MSLGKNALANLIGAFVPVLTGLATLPLYLKYIGTDRYGIIAIMWALLGYFGFLGMGRVVTQKMATLSASDDIERSNFVWTSLYLSVILSIIVAAFIYVAGHQLIHLAIKIPTDRIDETTSALLWLAIAFPFLMVASALVGALQGRMQFVQANIIQTLTSVLAQIFPLLIAASGRVEISYLLPSIVISRIVGVAMLMLQCRSAVPLLIPGKLRLSEAKSMLITSSWVSTMNLLATALMSIDRMIVAAVLGVRSVTFYSVPMDLVMRAMIASSSLASALFPELSKSNAEKSHALSARAATALSTLLMPLLITGIFYIGDFLRLWIGAELASSAEGVGEILLFGIWFNAIGVSYHSRLIAMNKTRLIAAMYILELPVFAVCIWQSISTFGLVGAALVWSARMLVDTALLLKANNALVSAIRDFYLQMFLLTVSILITSLNLQSQRKSVFFITIMCISTCINVKTYKFIASHLSAVLRNRNRQI